MAEWPAMTDEPMRPGLTTVTPLELTGLAAQLRAGADSIERTLVRLAPQLTSVREAWTGKGKARLVYDWQQWHLSAEQLHQALEDVAALLDQAAADYEARDGQAEAGSAGHSF